MKTFKTLIIGVCLCAMPVFAENGIEYKKVHWPFDGVMGNFDFPAIRRGFQVFREVCAACHGIGGAAGIDFHDLRKIGLTDGEITEFAKTFDIEDGPDETGKMYNRPGRISDEIPAKYKNDSEARAMNNGALPVPFGLVIKARHNAANYIYSILTGYGGAPEDFKIPEGSYYNAYFPGHIIAMPSPLSAGSVTYKDGTEASIDQMAKDVVNFLQWVGEPEMAHRKSLGWKVMIYLTIITGCSYILKCKVWKDIR